ncbi:hypothetical protein MnTg02_02595 [bacterium MnTg02]|nr:hypothetical protein MnTg02_02595 [bacterium MnTg02]
MVVKGTGISGAPTQLTEVTIERVEALARAGLRQTSIAAIIFSLKNVAQWSDGGIRGEATPALNVTTAMSSKSKATAIGSRTNARLGSLLKRQRHRSVVHLAAEGSEGGKFGSEVLLPEVPRAVESGGGPSAFCCYPQIPAL